MVLESTMICIDNSEYMRNGDFTPTRLQAQQDAANLVLQCKLRGNPENGVGVLSMAPKVDVLCSMTQDSSKLYMKLHQVQPTGECNVIAGIRVAQLALKHRQNKASRMRIVVFVGSPIGDVDEPELVKLAKKLKKEKVAVDVVCFGEPDTTNSDKMNKFIETLNGKDNAGDSHLIVVDSTGQSTLPEALLSSAVCRGEDGGAPPVSVNAAGGADLGFDPNEDPELAMALRVSLEEQRQRQEAEARQTDGAAPAADAAAAADTTAAAAAGAAAGAATTTGGAPAAAAAQPNLEAMTEDEQLEWALRMSMQQEEQAAKDAQAAASESAASMEVDQTAEAGGQQDLGELMSDPAMLQQLVSNLPDVDANKASDEKAKKDDKDKKKDEKK